MSVDIRVVTQFQWRCDFAWGMHEMLRSCSGQSVHFGRCACRGLKLRGSSLWDGVNDLEVRDGGGDAPNRLFNLSLGRALNR